MKKLFLFITFFSFNACALEKGLIFDWQRPADKQEPMQFASAQTAEKTDTSQNDQIKIELETRDHTNEIKKYEMFLDSNNKAAPVPVLLKSVNCFVMYIEKRAASVVCSSDSRSGYSIMQHSVFACGFSPIATRVDEYKKTDKEKSSFVIISAKCTHKD